MGVALSQSAKQVIFLLVLEQCGFGETLKRSASAFCAE
jgi:hypothetical protein